MKEPNKSQRSARRQPAEESIDLYPGLCVDDDRVSGSITVNQSRLPIWAFIYYAVVDGWGEVIDSFPQIEEEYGWTKENTGDFLSDLMEQRGEFGRLVLLLADVKRQERLAGMGKGPWLDNDEWRLKIKEQLQRCLDVLQD